METIKFKNFLLQVEQNTVGYHNDGPGSGFQTTGGALLGSNWTGSEADPTLSLQGHPVHLASLDLTLPDLDYTLVRKGGKIQYIGRNESNIPILLSDGTRLQLTYEEFKRIAGCKPEPKIGDHLSVTFLRNPTDNSVNLSQVQNCRCTPNI